MTESHLLGIGKDKIIPVFVRVFEGRSRSAQDVHGGDLDECRVEAQAAYRARLGRWSKEALCSVVFDVQLSLLLLHHRRTMSRIGVLRFTIRELSCCSCTLWHTQKEK